MTSGWGRLKYPNKCYCDLVNWAQKSLVNRYLTFKRYHAEGSLKCLIASILVKNKD